jgi:hypothetical protein
MTIDSPGLIPSDCGSGCPRSSGRLQQQSGRADGRPVMGALDTHCKDADGGVMATVIGACMPLVPVGGRRRHQRIRPDAVQREGDDDDCKYHVKWTATGDPPRTPTSPSR